MVDEFQLPNLSIFTIVGVFTIIFIVPGLVPPLLRNKWFSLWQKEYTEADSLQMLSFCPTSESVCMLKNDELLVDWWLMCTSRVSLMVIVTGGDSSFSSLKFWQSLHTLFHNREMDT